MVDGERRTIFSGLSFAIEPGEIVDLVGPSGAGKSSLLTAFARLNPRASGDLRLDGRSADDFTPQQWRAQVAYLPQKPVLLGETVAQAIRLPFMRRSLLPCYPSKYYPSQYRPLRRCRTAESVKPWTIWAVPTSI